MVKNLPAYVGDRFDPYVWEGSTCLNYCAQVPLSPCSATREASEVRSRVVVPPAATRESPCTAMETSCTSPSKKVTEMGCC